MATLYMPSLSYWPVDSRIYHLLSRLLLPVKSPALAIILLSLLYLFASKPGTFCTHNSIESFLITSSSVVCSEFSHIMVRVKWIIFNYFKFFKTRLTLKQMKYIGSLFMLVFVYSKVSPAHFLHVSKIGCVSRLASSPPKSVSVDM